MLLSGVNMNLQESIKPTIIMTLSKMQEKNILPYKTKQDKFRKSPEKLIL
jgi:hypothetical protein